MKYIILSLIASLISFNLYAETLRFRSGQVLSAEITTDKIKIGKINPDAPPLKSSLIAKHYNRKHGKNAYYGQESK